MRPAAKTPPHSDTPPAASEGATGGGASAGTSPRCIAALRVDGGTRFALEVDPRTFEADPELPAANAMGAPIAAPAAFRRVLGDLREPTTREQERRWREEGGRVVMLPLPQLTLWTRQLAAQVTVTGSRRECITLHVPDVAHVRISVETGRVALQLKARALWADGYTASAEQWLDLVLWWCTGRHATLDQMHREGWRTTGLELCSDFVGLDFHADDGRRFVGFHAHELVRVFSRRDGVETLNVGTRASNVSLCIYDKDNQVAKAKGGDDSAYRRVHLAGGWDGVAPRRRVEFRLANRGLLFHDESTGQTLNLRDPAVLADREALALLWGHLCRVKRLVLGDRTRHERATVDPRWEVVASAAGELVDDAKFRQSRELHEDAWREATRRASRDARRALRRFAALHDIEPNVQQVSVLRLAEALAGEDDDTTMRAYQEGYRAIRGAFLGEEIETLGRDVWDAFRAQGYATPMAPDG